MKKGRIAFLTTKIDSFNFELEFLKEVKKQKLTIKSLNVHPREDIQFTNFRLKTILNEFVNFVSIIGIKSRTINY